MRSRGLISAVLIGAVALSVLTSIASGQGESTYDEFTPQEVAFAETGIPGVSEESCAGDPQGPGCPEVEAIVIDQPLSDFTEPSPPPALIGQLEGNERSGSERRNLDWTPDDGQPYARPATPADVCAVKARMSKDSGGGPYGVARAFGKNTCKPYPGLAKHEVTTVLYEWIEAPGRWDFKKADSNSMIGPGTVETAAQKICDGAKLKLWRSRAVGYAVIGGVGYSGVQDDYANINCK